MGRLSSIRTFALASGLCVLGLVPDAAEAGVRARVDIHEQIGPAEVRVRVQTPDYPVRHRTPVVVTQPHLVVSHHDHAVIERLSIVTGIPERPLLRQRARGMTWDRIAYVHDISPREMRIAQNPARFRAWVAANIHPVRYDDHHDHHDHHGWKGHGKGRGKGKGRCGD